MSPNDKADAIREPRMGDVWEKNKASRRITGFSPRWLEYEKTNGHFGFCEMETHRRWCRDATLIERGPEVRG